MKRDIQLVGLDLDGTTLNSKKEITPRVRQAIANATAAGITVLPATGRAREGLPPAFLSIPGVRYALCTNGAMVYDLAGGPPLVSRTIEKKTTLELLKILDALNTLPAVFLDGVVYCGNNDYSLLSSRYDDSLIRYLQASRNAVPNLAELVEKSVYQAEKISLIFYQLEDREKTIQALKDRTDCVLTSSMPDNLEINAPGVNKGQGLLELGQVLGFGKDQVMAIGDGINDLEMLQAVGYGVAMGNAVPEVLAIADWVTASCDEDGVAVAIESIMPGGT